MIIILFSTITEEQKGLVNKIFSSMNKKMYNIAFNILKNSFDAEEAIGQTFLKIIDNIEKISTLPCPQMEAYCVIILKNETMNIIRKRKKLVYIEGTDHIFREDLYHNGEEGYLKILDREELLPIIKKLKKDEKRLIYLRFINGMKFKEIASLLDIPEETVKKRSQRILKKLRLYYEEGERSGQDI